MGMRARHERGERLAGAWARRRAEGHTKMRDIVNFMNFTGEIAPDSATCRLGPVGFA
jgi:hypothetical protein